MGDELRKILPNTTVEQYEKERDMQARRFAVQSAIDAVKAGAACENIISFATEIHAFLVGG